MQTLKVDILNDKVINLLKDLERLNLIRLHEDEDIIGDVSKYKGAMTKQPLDDVNVQLQNLRKGWE